MEQVVYADVLWLIDFSMDLLSLGLAGRMTSRAARPWRLCLAAALGGVWSVSALVWGLDGGIGLVLDLAAAAGMVLLAFGGTSLFRFAATLGCFCFSALLLGGSMTALANLFAVEQAQIGGGGFLLLALAGSVVTLLGSHLRRRAAPRRVSVEFALDGRRLVVDALTDSGNLVRDPVTGRGVIFVAPERLRELVRDPLRACLLAGRAEGMADLPPTDARRLCLVPAETVQGRGILLALRPDAVIVEGETCAALIAPLPAGTGRDYAAVLPADLAPAERRYILHK